jgi:hypothetical protein
MTKPKLDHESTNRIGDETELILIHLTIVCGVDMPSMIGEEESFDINDLHKLRPISRFQTNIPNDQFVK